MALFVGVSGAIIGAGCVFLKKGPDPPENIPTNVTNNYVTNNYVIHATPENLRTIQTHNVPALGYENHLQHGPPTEIVSPEGGETADNSDDDFIILSDS